MCFSRPRVDFGVCAALLITAVILLVSPGVATAQQEQAVRQPAPQPLSLAQAEPPKTPQPAARTEVQTQRTETIAEDDVAERQSIDAYTSLEDGQPGNPGEWEIKLKTGWQTRSDEHDPVFLEPELEYTLDGSEFLRNTKLKLAAPLELGLGEVDGNGDVDFGWQQRWVKEEGMMPSLSTLAEMRIPTGCDSSGVDGTLTGILAKDLGPGTAYFNAFMKTANGHNIDDVRHFQWGFRAGYKWRITEALGLVTDYVHQSSEETGHANSNILEIAAPYKISEHLTVGPGIAIGLDRHEETPYLGAGITMKYSF